MQEEVESIDWPVPNDIASNNTYPIRKTFIKKNGRYDLADSCSPNVVVKKKIQLKIQAQAHTMHNINM